MIFPVNGMQNMSVAEAEGFVSFQLAGQWLGIPVVRVQEVLVEQRVSPVPLAPPQVSGFLNLRGQIVTAIDLRTRLGIPPREASASYMNIVVRDGDELFSLVADTVGDVVDAAPGAVEPSPRTLDPTWRACCDGVIRLPTGLLIVLNVDELLRSANAAA
jgi:purine-binding chemotaxis protein CheW